MTPGGAGSTKQASSQGNGGHRPRHPLTHRSASATSVWQLHTKRVANLHYLYCRASTCEVCVHDEDMVGRKFEARTRSMVHSSFSLYIVHDKESGRNGDRYRGRPPSQIHDSGEGNDSGEITSHIYTNASGQARLKTYLLVKEFDGPHLRVRVGLRYRIRLRSGLAFGFHLRESVS